MYVSMVIHKHNNYGITIRVWYVPYAHGTKYAYGIVQNTDKHGCDLPHLQTNVALIIRLLLGIADSYIIAELQ